MIGPSHPITGQAVVEAIVEAIPWLVALLLVPLTHLGSVLVIVPALGLAYLKRPRLVLPWIGAVGAYYGVVASVKSLNSTSRPDVDPPIEATHYPEFFSWWYDHATAISTTSFPSGNAMVATLLAGFLTFDMDVGTLRQRALVTGTVAGLVSFSRVGIGVHYPIDVVGGIFLGLVLLAVIHLVRLRAADPVAATLALALVPTAFAVWVTTPVTNPPAVEALVGSNRHIAFGGVLGCLIGWHLKGRYVTPSTRMDTVAVGMLTLVLLVSFSGVGFPSNPVSTGVRTVLFCSAFVVLPWVFPGRTAARDPANRLERAD